MRATSAVVVVGATLIMLGCATNAQVPTMLTDRALGAVKAGVEAQAIGARAKGAATLDQATLAGWAIRSLELEALPPFSVRSGNIGGEFLIAVKPGEDLHTDRYVSLSTKWMVSQCQDWILAIRRAHEEALQSSRLKLAPVQCSRLITPDRQQVYDVVAFFADSGSFLGSEQGQAAAKRLVDRFAESRSIYGPWTRALEPQVQRADVANGIGVGQLVVHRYTYRTTFMHAEFGKRRVYDSYVLLLIGPQTLTVIQTLSPPEVPEDQLWRGLSSVIGALRQGR
jgi:hypothetical protein